MPLERAGKLPHGHLRGSYSPLLPAIAAKERSAACTGDTKGPRRTQKPLLKATGLASSRDRSRNEATQIPASVRHATSGISSVRSQLSLPAAKAETGSSTALPENTNALLLRRFQGSHSKVNSFQGGLIQISPIDTRKLSIVTDKGNEGCCCCQGLNLPEDGEREKGRRQHNVVPGEREMQALSAGIHPGWAANTVMIKLHSFLTTHTEQSSSQQ